MTPSSQSSVCHLIISFYYTRAGTLKFTKAHIYFECVLNRRIAKGSIVFYFTTPYAKRKSRNEM